MSEITPATVLSSVTLIFVIIGFAFTRGDRGGARSSAVEAKQIQDNTARKEEISELGHKLELYSVKAASAQEACHRDTLELKRKVDELIQKIGSWLERKGPHGPSAGPHE